MSIEIVRQLIEVHALNPTPIGDEMVRAYVPFDELLGNERTEAALDQAMTNGTRVAIVGPSGCGKSSLSEWVLGAPGGSYAATRVPVSVERDETVSDPQAFAQHVIRTVSKNAVNSALISPEERDSLLRYSGDRMIRPGREVTRRGGLGLQAWLFKGELARDVTTYVETLDQARSTTTIVGALDYLIRLIAQHDLRPIFVIDDSDAWLNVEGVKDRRELVDAFFGRVLRMLAELPCGLVVAVHTEYLGTPGYRQAEGFLERAVNVPQLPDAESLGRVLEHRIQLARDDVVLGEIFEPASVEQLYGYYAGAAGLSLRKTMQAAQSAIHLASESDADLVTEQMVEAAISEWS